MKYLTLLFLISVSCTAMCQSQTPKSTRPEIQMLNNDSSLQFWANAVVNIECRIRAFSDSQINEYGRQLRSDTTKKISQTEIDRICRELMYVQSTSTGTGFLIEDGGKKYIVTAKHVLRDKNMEYGGNIIISTKIFVRTLLDAALNGNLSKGSAMNLSAGMESNKPYQLSNDYLDIAIISLQSLDTKELLSDILKSGLQFIPISLINKSAINRIGDNILTIGFPAISQIDKLDETYRHSSWHSNIVSYPNMTFGRISMQHKSLPYYIGDITVYPGNSGGPVISEGKVIGLVSGQVIVPLEAVNPDYQLAAKMLFERGVLAIIFKSEFILETLNKLQAKEKYL